MYDPTEHEPLTDTAFDRVSAQAFIVETVASKKLTSVTSGNKKVTIKFIG